MSARAGGGRLAEQQTRASRGRRTPGLFEAYGIEIEYMAVHSASLDVAPVAHRFLQLETDGRRNEAVSAGNLSWSNELTSHVLELKTVKPVRGLDGLADSLQREVVRANAKLALMGAALLPGAAHPWMDPRRETVLWSHRQARIYRQFDRIFDCRRHGWSNLQSVHLNLPFLDDEEFGRLHAAVRLLLPLMPALAASSPYLDGRFTGFMDSRMNAYRLNSLRVPEVTGPLLPEGVFSPSAYREKILAGMYEAMRPHDSAGILRGEWLNARAAIPRFERNTIEIRILDTQETPAADLAVAWALIHVLRDLVEERWSSAEEQKRWAIRPLRSLLLRTIRDAEQAQIDDMRYLRALGYPGKGPCSAAALWAGLLESCVPCHPVYSPRLDLIRDEGPLARRLLRAAGPRPDRPHLQRLYQRLKDGLNAGKEFVP